MNVYPDPTMEAASRLERETKRCMCCKHKYIKTTGQLMCLVGMCEAQVSRVMTAPGFFCKKFQEVG